MQWIVSGSETVFYPEITIEADSQEKAIEKYEWIISTSGLEPVDSQNFQFEVEKVEAKHPII